MIEVTAWQATSSPSAAARAINSKVMRSICPSTRSSRRDFFPPAIAWQA
jgi:hypothetical protein